MIFFKTLCDHITKICISANKDFAKNSLTHQDRSLILRKILITACEFNFVNKFDFFKTDNVVKILLETLVKLDPFFEGKITGISILKLSQFCVSNESQDIFFSIIFKSIERPLKSLPIFKLNYELKDTSKIDQYFKSCFDIMNSSSPQSSQISPVALAVTIVQSPFSIESTNIFMKLINTENLILEFVEFNLNSNKLIFRLIKSNELDNFIKLLTADLCARNAAVKTLKDTLELRKSEHDLILKINHNALEMPISAIAEYIKIANLSDTVLISYFDIDPDLINELIRKLDEDIRNIIELMKTIVNPSEKYIYLSLAYFYISLIPICKSHFLPKTSYELLLHFKIEIRQKGGKLILPFSKISRTVSLPYVEVTLNGLEMLWSIIKSDFAGNKSLMILTASTILMIRRSINQFDNAELFKMIFFFFQSHQIDFSIVAGNLLQEFSGQNFENIFKFCKNHKFFSKSEIFIIENFLSNLNFKNMEL